MNHPTKLLYSKSHEWVALDGDHARIGVTDYAQEAMGDIVFVSLPAEGQDMTVGEAFAELESVKAVAPVYAPVSGTISAVNEALLEAPETINQAPYDAWIIEVKEITDRETLMSSEEYEAFVAKEKEA